MMSRKTLILASVLCLVSGLGASPVWPAPVLTGEVCDVRVHELTSQIHWYDNLHKAEDAAKQQGKLIFWMHILGRIDGAT